MKLIFPLIACLYLGSACAYSGNDIYKNCLRYQQQRSPGHVATREDALAVGMCLGMSMAIYDMLRLTDSRTTHICLPPEELTPRDVALLFLRRAANRDFSNVPATGAILGSFLAEYPCKAR